MRLTEDERKKANMLASMIDCSPHEWPKDQHEIQLLCHGYLDRVADNHNLRARIAELEAERDAARAGEARAVEAIKGLLNQLHEFDFEIDGSVEFFDSVQQCRDATDNTQPALDWLAQREREAVVAELRDWAERWWESHSDFSAGDFTQRIAALTNQQPTACPRSEVRGEENNNA